MKPFQPKTPGNLVSSDLNTRESPKDKENGDGNPRTDTR